MCSYMCWWQHSLSIIIIIIVICSDLYITFLLIILHLLGQVFLM